MLAFSKIRFRKSILGRALKNHMVPQFIDINTPMVDDFAAVVHERSGEKPNIAAPFGIRASGPIPGGRNLWSASD
jgi:hypothetical protein